MSERPVHDNSCRRNQCPQLATIHPSSTTSPRRRRPGLYGTSKYPIKNNTSVRTSIIAAYAPTEVSDCSVKDSFYQELQATFDLLPSNNAVIPAGDMNAETGCDAEICPGTIGRYGGSQVNDISIRMLSFASGNGPVVSGCFSESNPDLKYFLLQQPENQEAD